MRRVNAEDPGQKVRTSGVVLVRRVPRRKLWTPHAHPQCQIGVAKPVLVCRHGDAHTGKLPPIRQRLRQGKAVEFAHKKSTFQLIGHIFHRHRATLVCPFDHSLVGHGTGEEEETLPTPGAPSELTYDGAEDRVKAHGLVADWQVIYEGACTHRVEDHGHRRRVVFCRVKYDVHGKPDLHGHVSLETLQRLVKGLLESETCG
mmetsp:Transcript_41404/g.95971  ORF Transcript_41404/g.95971 Transcript_41404/m.95971 type:complete len:202 (+) Transcript_41404:333-938(+)